MRIADVLQRKGATVATVSPGTTVAELLAGLARHNVGAMVVVDAEGGIAGIVSERDVVRKLHEHGPSVLQGPVADIMTTMVASCTPDDPVDQLSVVMTERRIRHVPVLDGGRLAGIVSIGDVVKIRMEQLEQSQEQLEAYISQG
ncbi:CBS domain-containing protein [Amycolatopsis orientalis]|uniref:CBS domain-containing protein n=1 Tax=Amycolatopsis orientalis TaxID=31958 RepID=UPI00039BCCD9|nr:CBS domain-containing protein [Amycolatopsis orientalis]